MASSYEQFQFLDEEGRQEIYKWSKRRQKKYKGFGRFFYLMKIYAFDKSLLKSFVHNVNVIVLVQMILAGIVTYLCSFAADFQRREKVLEDLANFKASTMVWFFCVRDWRVPGVFDEGFMKAVSSKTKGLMFHLREYLLTEKAHKRNFILRLNALIYSLMCLSFERLRVIREYRSPRSIRSFTKIFIFALPLLLSPYYVYLGRQVNNRWSPYFIAVLVAFLFGALQGVQDKLDDPFDGMSEDDINLETLDEWTIQSLEATANRTVKVGRFTVSVQKQGKVEFTASMNPPPGGVKREESFGVNRAHARKSLGLLPWQRQLSQLYSEEENSPDFDEINEMHPYKDILSNLPGNATIVRGGHVKERRNFEDILQNTSTQNTIDPNFEQGFFQTPNSTVQKTIDSQQSLGKKVQFNRIFYESKDSPSSSRLDQLPVDKAEGYPPVAFDAPKSFRCLFLQDQDHVIQPEPLKRQSSLPSSYLIEAPVQRKRSISKGGSESANMIAHPGVGVASYINSMNKEKLRKLSAPILHAGHSPSEEKAPDMNSFSSDESVGIVMEKRSLQESGQSNQGSLFYVQKAKPVSLSTISPDFKDEATPTLNGDSAVDWRNSRNGKQSGIGDEGVKLESVRPNNDDRQVVIEIRKANSKTKLLGENDGIDNEVVDKLHGTKKTSPGGTPKEQRKAPKKKFAVTKGNLDIKLATPAGSSSDSLSKVVGKLKDEEVFL
eukprot:gene17164-8706_t